MTIGQRIKEARKKAGLIQKQLGEKMGVSYQTIAQWETGRRNPKGSTLAKIAAAIGMDSFALGAKWIETNADRIRAMTDEELAKKIYLFPPILGGPSCGCIQDCPNDRDGGWDDEICVQCALEWLKQPYEGGEDDETD
jgi:transcriptional regulator with XRE-family HTH domain